MSKELFYVRTNGYDMVVMIGLNNDPIKYITETEDFPKLSVIFDSEDIPLINDFLTKIKDNDDYSTWEESELLSIDLDKFLGINKKSGYDNSVILGAIKY